MRTSLNEIKEIEEYLLKYSTPEDTLLFEARMVLQPGLKQKAEEQLYIYSLIRKYSRKQMKAEIEDVHEQLFKEQRHKNFRHKILRLFSKP